jgi:hypothetical protein
MAGTAAVRPGGSRQAAGVVSNGDPCYDAVPMGGVWLHRLASGSACGSGPSFLATWCSGLLACSTACSASYPVRVHYMEGEVGAALSRHPASVCGAGCALCRSSLLVHMQRANQQRSASATQQPGWDQVSMPAHSEGSASSSGPLQSSMSNAVQPGQHPPGMASATATAHPGMQPGSLATSPPAFTQHAAGAALRQGAAGERWRVVEGDFAAVMLIVMPCRSDKTPAGMARFGHLTDGRLKLVLVSKCAPLQVGPWPPRGCAAGGNGRWRRLQCSKNPHMHARAVAH